jgi:hypothetical protein
VAKEEPRRKPLIAVDGVPRRELARIGAYVRFIKPHKIGKRKMKPGEMAVITTDTRGKCRPGMISIRLPGVVGYTTVPENAVEVIRCGQ